MSRTRYVYRPDDPRANEFGMIDATLAAPLGVDPHVYVISDTMDPTRHMATGEYFTSKAAFRAATRAAGCIEYGNELPTLTKPRPSVKLDRGERRDAIRRAVSQIRSGRRIFEER